MIRYEQQKEKFIRLQPLCWFRMCLPAGSGWHPVLLCITRGWGWKAVVFTGVSPPTRDVPLIRRKFQCDSQSLGNAPQGRFHPSLASVINIYDSNHGSLNSTPRWRHPMWFSRHPGSIVTGMVFVQEIGEVVKGQIAGGTTSKPGLYLGKGVHTDAPSHHHSSPQTNTGYHH